VYLWQVLAKIGLLFDQSNEAVFDLEEDCGAIFDILRECASRVDGQLLASVTSLDVFLMTWCALTAWVGSGRGRHGRR
jgi:hypothetical protein